MVIFLCFQIVLAVGFISSLFITHPDWLDPTPKNSPHVIIPEYQIDAYKQGIISVSMGIVNDGDVMAKQCKISITGKNLDFIGNEFDLNPNGKKTWDLEIPNPNEDVKRWNAELSVLCDNYQSHQYPKDVCIKSVYCETG